MALEVFLGLDNSISMGTKDQAGGSTRMAIMKEFASSVITKTCDIDADGPEVWTIGLGSRYKGNVTTQKAVQIFHGLDANEAGTASGEFIAQACAKAKKAIEQGKEALILLLTDGAASDRLRFKRAIIDMTQWLVNTMGVQIVEVDDENNPGQKRKVAEPKLFAIQIAYISNEALGFLKDLDDNLVREGALFDCVDTTEIGEAAAMDVEGFLYKSFTD